MLSFLSPPLTGKRKFEQKENCGNVRKAEFSELPYAGIAR